MPGTWRLVELFGVPVFQQDLGCSCSLATGPLLAAQTQHLVTCTSAQAQCPNCWFYQKEHQTFLSFIEVLGLFLLEMCCRNSQAGFELAISRLTTLTCCSGSKSLKGGEQTLSCRGLSPLALTWLKHRSCA